MKQITIISLLLTALYGCSKGSITEIPDINSPEDMVEIYFSDNLIEARNTDVNMPIGSTVRVFALKRSSTSASPTTDNIMSEKCYEVTAGGMIPCNVDNNGVVTDYQSDIMKLLPGAYDFYLISPALPLDVSRRVTIHNGTDFITSINPVTVTINKVETQEVVFSGLKHLCHLLYFNISRSSGATYLLDIGDGITLKQQPSTATYQLGDQELTVNSDNADYLITPNNFSLSNNVITGGAALLHRSVISITIQASLKINTILRTFSPTTINTIMMNKGEKSTSNLTVQYTPPNNDPPVNLILNNISILPWTNQTAETITPIN